MIKKVGRGAGRFLDAIWIHFARFVLIFLTILLYRPKVYYEQKKHPYRRLSEACVLTCNHLRGCDGAVVSMVFHRTRIHSIAADRWYRKWYLRPLFEAGYSIPINRTTTWIRKSVQCIKKGDSVLIFPEGKAVPGARMCPFKPGFLLLARTAEVPVMPLYMEGCYNRPFLKRLRIAVGTPYYPDPPLEGETQTEYYDRQCAVLYEKTVALRELMNARRHRKAKK